MSDTQWPRYEVFVQDAEGRPHENAGSVHAVDDEMALQNARDVFTRRPRCVSLWVAPAAAILSKTRQELQTWQPGDTPQLEPVEEYLTFGKLKAAGNYVYLGKVAAGSHHSAMRKALETFSQSEPLAWWVLPASSLVCSSPADAGPMFSPALDKPFRLSSAYHVVTMMREAFREAGDGS